jgi:hypothetical protein
MKTKTKEGLDDDTGKPEGTAAGDEIEKGQGRPFILAVGSSSRVNHPAPDRKAVKENKEKIER